MPSKGFRRNRKGARGGSKKPKMSFAKRVLSVIRPQRELKCGTPLTGAITDVREGITLVNRTTNVMGLLAAIPQGTAEYQRIGNAITLKKIVIRGYYRLQLPIGAAANTRILVRNFIWRQRNIIDAATLTSGAVAMNYNLILEPANAYLGSIADYNTPVNTDSFIVKKQYKKIMTAEYDGTANALGMAESYVFFNYTMTFGKGKALHYRTDGATSPEDFPYFMCHSAAPLGSGTALAVGLVGFNYTATPYFFDD